MVATRGPAPRAAGTVAVILAVVAACSTAPGPSPSGVATGIPPASPAASPPAASGSASVDGPVPSLPGGDEWTQVPAGPALADADLTAVERVGDELLGVGCRRGGELGCAEPAVWRSRDGLTWEADAPVVLGPGVTGGTVLSAAPSAAGPVVAGVVNRGEMSVAAAWLRTPDGWTPIALPAAENAAVGDMRAAAGGIVAVGFGAFTEAAGFRAWHSPDGASWRSVSTSGGLEGYPTGLLDIEGAFVAWGPSCNYCVAPSGWWTTIDGRAWRDAAAPRGIHEASLTSIARSGDGYLAFGSVGGGGDIQAALGAWTAPSSFAPWRAAEPPTDVVEASVTEQLEVLGGTVAAGIRTGEGGLAGLVWTRAPDEPAWREVLSVPGFEVVGLVEHPGEPGRVVALGRADRATGAVVDIWTGRVGWDR